MQSTVMLSIHLSNHPSVCLSVTFKYRDHVHWNATKIISK